MATTNSKTQVLSQEEVEVHQVQRTKKGRFGFVTEWWETVRTDSIGNDIHISSDRKLRHIYVNGELVADLESDMMK